MWRLRCWHEAIYFKLGFLLLMVWSGHIKMWCNCVSPQQDFDWSTLERHREWVLQYLWVRFLLEWGVWILRHFFRMRRFGFPSRPNINEVSSKVWRRRVLRFLREQRVCKLFFSNPQLQQMPSFRRPHILLQPLDWEHPASLLFMCWRRIHSLSKQG